MRCLPSFCYLLLAFAAPTFPLDPHSLHLPRERSHALTCRKTTEKISYVLAGIGCFVVLASRVFDNPRDCNVREKQLCSSLLHNQTHNAQSLTQDEMHAAGLCKLGMELLTALGTGVIYTGIFLHRCVWHY
jgi:hypothetical protein